MLLSNLNLLATAPGGVARLRELILTLAVQGKLVAQDPTDEPASELLKKIRAEKDRLMAEGKIKRDKPLAAIAEEEKPFEVPKGWEWVRLDAIADFTNGFAFPSGQFSSDSTGIGIIKIGDIQDGVVTTAGMSFVSRDYAQTIDSTFNVAPGDMLIAMSGATTGKLGFNLTGSHFFLNQRVGRIALHFIDRQYAYSYLRTKVAENLSISAGSAIPNLSTAQIKEIVFPLPPLAEQSRIVTRVEELMRLCDALEAQGQLEAKQHSQLVSTLFDTLLQSPTPEALTGNWQRVATHFDLLLDRPQAVDALEQTILQLAVRGLLVPQDPTDEPASQLLKTIRREKDCLILAGKIKRDKPLPPIAEEEQPFEVPKGWEWARTGDLVKASEAGWSPTCLGSPRTNGKWGVLKVSAVSWGSFDSEANKELPADLVPRPEYEVKDGDFLLSRANTEELVARSVVVKVAPSKLMLSDRIIRLDVSSWVNREFLNFCNNARHARIHYIANASGTSSSMKNVSREVVLTVPIPLPPLPEQSRIVARVEALRQLCADLRQRLAHSQTVQAQLAEALVASQTN